MATKTQLVRSEGIFHALPTYPDDDAHQNLTAIVTGANGISGYHMVKVLAAAPTRWSKIYCLSRRPPPDYFFTELGDGAQRVSHVEADFLGSPTKLAEQLRAKIDKVDHVFFFSYTQPTQKGAVLGMWSDAEALAHVNTSLITNFTQALTLANLKPKRFLLQTGAKHYGFHIGPATSPSFESDSRITLEENFYYPQEDALTTYCAQQGVQWNVVRPSYIIGAVRDNLLNYLVGFGVFASVSGAMKTKMRFPGDYNAWDREHCQSSGLMNAYLEEWAVLTGKAGDEAFNVQDGLPFTWGRAWAYFASWYGTGWEPPETDLSKYKEVKSRWEETPRGYGPHGVTRYMFSLVEWAEDLKVQETWKELSSKHGLLIDPFKDRQGLFGISDSAVIGGWPLSLSMRKARKMGFHGNVDSYESMFNSLNDLARIKVLPPMKAKQFEEVVP